MNRLKSNPSDSELPPGRPSEVNDPKHSGKNRLTYWILGAATLLTATFGAGYYYWESSQNGRHDKNSAAAWSVPETIDLPDEWDGRWKKYNFKGLTPESYADETPHLVTGKPGINTATNLGLGGGHGYRGKSRRVHQYPNCPRSIR